MGASAKATIATSKQNKRTTLSARETHTKGKIVTFFLHAQRTNDLSDGPTICRTDGRFVRRTNHMSHGWKICWTEERYMRWTNEPTDERNHLKDMDEKGRPLWGRFFLSVNFLLGN
jgi:hypothetical protein